MFQIYAVEMEFKEKLSNSLIQGTIKRVFFSSSAFFQNNFNPKEPDEYQKLQKEFQQVL